ncbi:hypothetical protein BKA61DRAFT_27528 [Leptodontidium sp. MPI-SDFR-AT-0119]|nr:hypothetical protein BKA61DRAFT_27528 [Leptodontidium sp. MPI-SDFR-AT-0119]
MAISKVQLHKQRAKALETREKQKQQRQQKEEALEKAQLRALNEIEAEAAEVQHAVESYIRRQQEEARAAVNLEWSESFWRREAKRLESYNVFAEQYNRNLQEEGFTHHEGLWQKDFYSKSKQLRTIQFHHLKPLSNTSRIPKKLGHSPIYKRVRWGDIQAKCLWYMDRNADYESLGFVKALGTSYKRHPLPYDGMMSFFASGDPCEAWTWPGARDGDALPCEPYPEDGMRYKPRHITDMDELIMTRKGWCRFAEDQKTLPSAQLGDWQDHWHRGMRDTKLEAEEYASAVEAHHFSTQRRKRKTLTWHPRRIEELCWGSWRYEKVWRDWWLFTWNIFERYTVGRGCYDRRVIRRVVENSDWILRLARRRHAWLSNRKRFSFWSQQIQHIDEKIQTEYTTFEVPGYINGRSEVAFPDSGSDYNLASSDYISRNNHPYIEQRLEITLPNGNTAITEGVAHLEWSFEDVPGEVHKLQFHILKNCVHNILLGNPFLELTQLNTANQHRVKERVSKELTAGNSPVYDCHLVGNTKQWIKNRMHGELNGQRMALIPDSGCRVNVISLALARALGKEIKYSGERGKFRFIDGSTAPSLGMVQMTWRPDHSNEEYMLEFEIMEDCNGIILGQKFLYGNRAFVKHAACLTNDSGRAPEIANDNDSISRKSYYPAPSLDKPPDHLDIQTMLLDIFEIDDEKGKVYEVSWLESPWRRLCRRLRGGRSHTTGPRSGIQSEAQNEMEWRATVENEILRMRRGEARTRAVMAELQRRRAKSDDDRGNEFLMGLLPRKGTSSRDSTTQSSSEEASSAT